MPNLATGTAWTHWFTDFTSHAWRLETLPAYHEPDEDKPLRAFLSGRPVDTTWITPWLDTIRAATHAGRRFQRVRVLTDPLTDYLRWELATFQAANLPAGEDIRVLALAKAQQLQLPLQDYWLFDDHEIALMHFHPNGPVAGVELLRDPDTLKRYLHCRDLAWRHATPLPEYLEA